MGKSIFECAFLTKNTTYGDQICDDAIIKGARYLLIIHELLVAMGFFSCRGAR